jgi:hypothetical protein
MGSRDSHDKLPSRMKRHSSPKAKKGFPKVFIDSESDFASIKIAPGIEARSYLKDGVLFSED